MATPLIGLAVTPRRSKTFPATIATAGMAEGAAVIYDIGNQVKAPTAALALGFAGLIASVPGPAGTVAGADIELQRDDIGQGLLQAGASVNRGDDLVIAGVDGSLRAFVPGVDLHTQVIGASELTITAGANAVALPVNLDMTGRIA